jgi:hypothetical protein
VCVWIKVSVKNKHNRECISLWHISIIQLSFSSFLSYTIVDVFIFCFCYVWEEHLFILISLSFYCFIQKTMSQILFHTLTSWSHRKLTIIVIPPWQVKNATIDVHSTNIIYKELMMYIGCSKLFVIISRQTSTNFSHTQVE